MQKLGVGAVNTMSIDQVRELVDRLETWLSNTLAFSVDFYPSVKRQAASILLDKSQTIDVLPEQIDHQKN